MFTMKVSIFILRNLHFFLRPLPACYGNLSSWYQPWSWYQHLELLTEWRVSGKTVQKTVEKVKSYKRQESAKRKSYFKTVEGAKSYRRHDDFFPTASKGFSYFWIYSGTEDMPPLLIVVISLLAQPSLQSDGIASSIFLC